MVDWVKVLVTGGVRKIEILRRQSWGLGKKINRFYTGNRVIGLIIPVISWTPTFPQNLRAEQLAYVKSRIMFNLLANSNWVLILDRKCCILDM